MGKEVKKKQIGDKVYSIFQSSHDSKYYVSAGTIRDGHTTSFFIGTFDKKADSIAFFNSQIKEFKGKKSEKASPSEEAVDTSQAVTGKRRRKCSKCGELKFGVEKYHDEALCEDCVEL